MSFFSLLGTMLIGPLKLVFEIIFQTANDIVQNPGIAIIFLSLAMNFLVLPLYKRADAMQEAARDTEARLHDGVAHIKKTFSGDERMMILQAYYRQNGYKPTDVMKGSVSLLLEIPFFMAAYQFLSHLPTLNGIHFGPIADLGAPDGLLVIGGVTLNLLPILMTLINVISSAIYLKGFPLKTKIQLYGMAAFFLWFLYTSPSGLVFYWTLNNVFSLVKNIFYKLKNPKKVLMILSFVIGMGGAGYGAFLHFTKKTPIAAYLMIAGIVLMLPLFISVMAGLVKRPATKKKKVPKPSRKTFILGGLFMTLFVGLMIPSTYISSSPQEFVDLSYYHNPLWFIASSLFMAAGFFLVWFGVFYWLASPKGKVIFERAMVALCGISVVNYMLFGTNLGIISSNLTYENGIYFPPKEYVLNILVVAAIAVLLILIVKQWRRAVSTVLLTSVLALSVMSGINVVGINGALNEIRSGEVSTIPTFNLSKNGKNVIVLMIDRALGDTLPYIFAEKPDIAAKFNGFTYYSNTISYGGHTNMAAPAMMGGYEYTPIEMNRRDKELLVDKHNESLKVMPELFYKNGYEVTVCDAPYAGYTWIPDMSIYDEYEGMKAYITKGAFTSTVMKQANIDSNHRNFFCFGLMKSMPLPAQYFLYDNGTYHQSYLPTMSTTQVRDGLHKSSGMSQAFMEPYYALENLPTMTQINDGDSNTFLFFYNDATHEPMLLQTPDYLPAENVDNTEYDEKHSDRFKGDNGLSLNINSQKKMIHYHANVATLRELGEWFDYLRAEGVYDNTRIILAADHGYYLFQNETLIHDDVDVNDGRVDLANYYPLLMVKDFGATDEWSTDTQFMTNADVPFLAVDGLIENPTNPFTGKPITMDEKFAHDQFIMLSRHWSTASNNGKTFAASTWAIVSENLWDREDWEFIPEKLVLKDHVIPEK